MLDSFILKKCSNCNMEKEADLFPKRGNQCKGCCKIKRSAIKNKKQQYDQEYRSANREKLLQQQRVYDRANKDKIKAYKKRYVKRKRADDPVFRLRGYVSKSVALAIKLGGAKKSGSCLQYLPFSMDELKGYIEKQFEPWMTWENHGKYNSGTWDDHDPSTWAWQIDHIIPQSDLPYSSMTDVNFQKCWALSNLRPLSAKQNLIDGVTKARHRDNNA